MDSGKPSPGVVASEVSPPRAPRRIKSIAVTFCVVFPTMELLMRGVIPRLGPMPALLREALVVAMVCVTLSFVMPPLQARLRPWLLR
jgi:antibiotic biosynthesis monooxygenase (ABM) superfamily enzyme